MNDVGAADGPVTRDTLLRGRVTLLQPLHGFRSSLDPVLLAAFVRPPFGRFLDIGGGTGALSLLLLAGDAAAVGTAVEVQPRLARLSTEAAALNGWAGRLRVLLGDARTIDLPSGVFDLVVTNPPFRPVGAGLLPPDPERRIATCEVKLAMADWLDIAARVLAPEGRLAVVFPASRADELRAALAARGLAPTRLRLVRPRAGAADHRILLEARRGRGHGLAVLPPLEVHEGQRYSAQVRRMLGEEVGP